jgi:metallophosphoesterase (TIGR00282 family)
MSRLRVLLVGDVMGAPGRIMFQKHIDQLRAKHAIDAVIVNGENSDARGRGITPRIVKFFRHNGADVVTSGNHIWANKEIYSYLAENNDLLRPANYPSSAPGVGVTMFKCKEHVIGVVNLIGRVFMKDLVDCPFRTAESILTYLRGKTNIIFVDMHAETSAEKIAMGFFLDGRVSGVVGTHTHVQTADERILPKGTGFITDLGMTGSYNSMIGMKKEPIIQHFITQMPTKFVVEESAPVIMTGVWIEVDTATGIATAIERVKVIDEEIHLESNEQ